MNTISFCVTDVPEKEGKQQIRVLVDGEDLLSQIQDDGIGFNPRSFVNQDALDTDGELLIGLCGLCHGNGCCNTDVNIIFNDQEVIWEGVPESSPGVMLRFDRAQFEEAVRDIRSKYPEEMQSATAERRVVEEIDLSHLEAYGLRLRKTFHFYRNDIVCLFFYLEKDFSACFSIPWDGRNEDELLARVEEYVSISPQHWEDAHWSATVPLPRRPDETHECVGPDWEWSPNDGHGCRHETIEDKPEHRQMIRELLSAEQHEISFELVENHVRCDHQTRIIVNGIDLLLVMGMGDLGIDPHRFFAQDTLTEDGEILIGRCACGYETMRDRTWKATHTDDLVIWHEQPESHLVQTLTLRFDRKQFEQAVHQAKNDHSWENLQRTAERRIAEEVDMSHLETYGMHFEWASCRFRKEKAAVLYFQTEHVSVYLHVPWNLQDVDVIVDRVRTLVATSPEQWENVFCMADADWEELPDCAGPGWQWDKHQSRYCPRRRPRDVDGNGIAV